ncbi:MAG: hypothetical protein ACOC80_13090 [Petrotogales bacterium]
MKNMKDMIEERYKNKPDKVSNKYFVLPKNVIKDENLSLAAKGLFACMYYLYSEKGFKNVSVYDVFILNENMEIDKLSQAKRELVERGYIKNAEERE